MDGRIAANKARARPLAERFAAKYIEREDGCWQWTAAHNTDGYGHMWVDGRLLRGHRIAYELHIGEIPEGVEVHHLCGHRWCVNPDHLALVTRGEHQVIEHRTFVCIHGHRRRPAPNGKWVCPTCQAVQSRRYLERKRVGT